MCVSFRHWEAIKKWDEAIHLTPDNPVLYEMKSQVWAGIVSQICFKVLLIRSCELTLNSCVNLSSLSLI